MKDAASPGCSKLSNLNSDLRSHWVASCLTSSSNGHTPHHHRTGIKIWPFSQTIKPGRVLPLTYPPNSHFKCSTYNVNRLTLVNRAVNLINFHQVTTNGSAFHTTKALPATPCRNNLSFLLSRSPSPDDLSDQVGNEAVVCTSF